MSAVTTGAQPILVPVDFSPDSEAALRWAAREAVRSSAPIVVLHVIHDPEAAPGAYRRVGPAGDLETHERVARERLTEFVDRVGQSEPELRAAPEVRLELVTGLPPNRILEVAERIGAGQIVMGGRGRTGLLTVLLGSKSQRVAQLATVPVTIVKDDPEKP